MAICYTAGMKIMSWNVNGIRAVHNKGLFVPFVEQYQPDILGLQETKAQQNQSEVDLPGYQEYWNSAEKKGYSGTAIFTKTKPLSVINGLPEDIIQKFKVTGDVYGDPNKEGRVIAAEFDTFYVMTVYTPNAKDDLSRIPLRHKHWDPAFLAYAKGLETGAIRLDGVQGDNEKRTSRTGGTVSESRKQATQQSAKSIGGVSSSTAKQANAANRSGKPVIFMGDLNVAHTPDDLARPKENEGKKGYTQEERAGFQNFLDAGFIDTLRLFHQGNGFYTWWTFWANARKRNVGWRIDYILVSQALKDKVKDANIHPDVMGSDHCPVSIELEM